MSFFGFFGKASPSYYRKLEARVQLWKRRKLYYLESDGGRARRTFVSVSRFNPHLIWSGPYWRISIGWMLHLRETPNG